MHDKVVVKLYSLNKM